MLAVLAGLLALALVAITFAVLMHDGPPRPQDDPADERPKPWNDDDSGYV